MAQFCGNPVFQGLGECRKLMQNVIAMNMSIADAAKYTLAELETVTKTGTYMNAEGAIVSIHIPLYEYDDTTEEPKFETGANGIRMKTDDPMPQATAYMEASVADYIALQGIDFSSLDIELFTKDGFRAMVPLSDTKRKGFRANVNIRKGSPKVKDGMKMYPIYISYTSLAEWEKMEFLPIPYSAIEIQDLVPNGLTIAAKSPMVAGAQPLSCKLRSNSTGKVGLTDIVVIDSSGLTTPACAITDSGGGNYSIACTKATSTPLAAGDWIDIQASIVATTTVTYISNIIRLYGTT